MNIKTLLLVPSAIFLALICLPNAPVVAQSGDTIAPVQMERGKNRLNLTADQQRQMQELRSWTQTEIVKVIGADNLAKLQAARQSGGKMRGQLKDLNLTEQQKQAIRGIREEAKRRMQAILTEEQRNMLQQRRQGRQDQRQPQSGQPQ